MTFLFMPPPNREPCSLGVHPVPGHPAGRGGDPAGGGRRHRPAHQVQVHLFVAAARRQEGEAEQGGVHRGRGGRRGREEGEAGGGG